jgi:hypothetical protein
MDNSSEPINNINYFIAFTKSLHFCVNLDNTMGRLHTEASSSTVDFSSQQVFQPGNEKTLYSMKLIVI